MRPWYLATITALVACIGGNPHANVDLSRLPPSKIALIGTVVVYKHGYDHTGRTLVEATGDSRGFQLSESGGVVWVVDRPKAGRDVVLSGISTLDHSQDFAGGLVLARADVSQPCSYFGSIDIRIDESRTDELAQAVVGVSFPGGGARQYDDGGVALRRIVRDHPKLAGFSCDAVLRRAAIELR